MNENKVSGIGHIDLMQLLMTLLRKWFVILCCAIIAASGAFVYASFGITPLYRAKSTMLVDLRSSMHEDLSSEQINIAQKYVATFAYIMRTNTVLDPVIKELNLRESSSSLASKLQVSVIDDTLLIKVSIDHPNKNTAIAIIRSLVKKAPDVINQRITSGYITEIETPVVSSGPVSPNISRYCFMGFMLGVFISSAVIILIFVVNNRIKSISDLQYFSDLPILGIIPVSQNTETKSKGVV